ncbi:MAG: efflux RND transporter periplasmic adaptor subunit [Myxococcales bacterium]
MNKKRAVGLLVAAGLVPLGLLARAAVGTGNAEGVVGPELARASRRDIATVVKATGVVRPALGAEVRVGAQVSGVLQRMRVRVGDRVVKGQPLAEVDARELSAIRDQAAAALQSANANQRFARSDFERKSKLAAAQALPPADLDLAERALALAEAAVGEATANLALANVRLEQARIRAPIGGIVSAVSMQEGEAVAAGFAAPSLLTIVDLDRLEVWAYVDETDIGRVHPGQRARFGVDTYPEDQFEGEVVAIYAKPEIRDNVVDYVAVLRFTPVAGRTLRPEMTTNVRIALEAHEGVLTVPRRAVRKAGGRSFVVCPQPGGFAKRAVVVGASDESSIEIVQGLREGEQVVVSELPAGVTPAE